MRSFIICALLICLTSRAAFAQSASNIEVTQIDAKSFPEITVYFRVTGDNGKRLPELREDMVSLQEGDLPVTIKGFKGYGTFESRTCLLVDTSSSMNESSGGPSATSRIQAAQQACLSFLKVIRSNDQIGLTEFNSVVKVLCPIGSDPALAVDRVNALGAYGETAWRDAVLNTLQSLATQPGRRTVLILSDGQDNCSRAALSEVTKEARRLQIPIHAIGLGSRDKVDADALERLASDTGGRFLLMPDATQLRQLYESLGVAVQEEVAVTYISNRSTPDGTRRDVKLFVRVDGKTLTQSTGYLERHLLNVSSDSRILVCLLSLIALAYWVPLRRDRQLRHQKMLARRDAFAKISVVNSAPPALSLAAAPYWQSIPAVPHDYQVMVRLVASLVPPLKDPVACQPVYVATVLDLSASMSGQRLSAAEFAIGSLLAGLSDTDTFSLTGFSDGASELVAPGRIGHLRQQVTRQLRTMRIGTTTFLAPALNTVCDSLPDASVLGNRKVCVLIVSDGRVEDSYAALEARDRFPSHVQFLAFGIGTDYDHEFLAKLCGGRDRVEHLESVEEARNAFHRFLKLAGRTVTCNSRIHFKPEPGVNIVNVRILQGLRPVSLRGFSVSIDDLSTSSQVTLFADLIVGPQSLGTATLAHVHLECDLPAYNVSEKSPVQRITVNVADHQTPPQSNPALAEDMLTLQNAMALAGAEEDVKQGNLDRATNKLRGTTGRLEKAGRFEDAQAVARITTALEEKNPDKAVKRAWRATQALTDPKTN